MNKDGIGNVVDPDGDYYIQDKRTVVGNCALWWAKDAHGYCCDLVDAGIFKGKEAASHRDTDVPWPVATVQQHITQHVRVESLHRLVDQKKKLDELARLTEEVGGYDVERSKR